MKIMFSAGEASGDTHGASVAKALSQIDSNIEMFGMGGTLMEQAGVRIVYDIITHLFKTGYVERKTGRTCMYRLSGIQHEIG